MAESLPDLIEAYGSAGTGELLRRAGVERARLVTLGPAGTSSHDAAEYFGRLLARDGIADLPIELHDRFERVLREAVEDDRCLALVPSAYSGATTFHWHEDLSLLFHFVRRTPNYGIASRGELDDGGPLRVAAMLEVEHLYPDLAPPHLAARPSQLVSARSTRHAAELVASGDAHVAVTNETSRTEIGLEWITSRPGVDIVWLIFGRARSIPQSAQPQLAQPEE